jgi:hypothetical protein
LGPQGNQGRQGPTGPGITDAASDNRVYGRYNGTWKSISEYNVIIATPSSGAVINLTANSLHIIAPATNIGSLTIVMPSGSPHGTRIITKFCKTVNSVTWAVSGGDVFMGSNNPGLVLAGIYIEFYYNSPNSTWY